MGSHVIFIHEVGLSYFRFKYTETRMKCHLEADNRKIDFKYLGNSKTINTFWKILLVRKETQQTSTRNENKDAMKYGTNK